MIPPLSRERAITQLAGERAMRQRRDIFASAYADKEAGRGLRDISATTEIRFYRQRGPERQLDIRRRRGNRSRELCRFYSPTTRREKMVSRTTPNQLETLTASKVGSFFIFPRIFVYMMRITCIECSTA